MTVPIDGTASPDERNAAIARFLFAPDWVAARDLVMSEPWLLSPQADNDLASASARFVEQEKADPNMIPLAGAIAIVRERLGRARQLGAGGVFDDLIALDGRLRAVSGMRWAADVYAAVREEPQLISDLGINELRLMLTRVYPHDESLGQQLWTLHNVVLRTRQEGIDFLRLLAEEQQQRAAVQADDIFAPLRLVAPPEATRQHVGQCERALALLERQTGSDLWFEVQARSAVSSSSSATATAAPTSRAHARSTSPFSITIRTSPPKHGRLRFVVTRTVSPAIPMRRPRSSKGRSPCLTRWSGDFVRRATSTHSSLRSVVTQARSWQRQPATATS